jgi:hypothetical protein
LELSESKITRIISELRERLGSSIREEKIDKKIIKITVEHLSLPRMPSKSCTTRAHT